MHRVWLSWMGFKIVYAHDVNADALSRLYGKCLDEVRRINGVIDFENAYKYQKREI